MLTMRLCLLGVVSCAAFLTFAVPLMAEPVSSRGAALAYACAACHGPEGQSQGAIPSLSMLSREGVVAALEAFRAGDRQGTVMNRIAKGLDDADIAAVAAYFSSLRER